jgi:hypothetical protein
MRLARVRPLRVASFVGLWALAACGNTSGESPPVPLPDAAPDALTDAAFAADANAATDADAAPTDADAATDSAAPTDADATVAAWEPAAHASLPQVQTFGGPVLTAPKVIPVFFANDPLQSQIEQFLAELVGSAYWTATTSEYGVGALQVAPSIVVSDAVPSAITDAQIQSFLAGYLDGTHPQWPAIAANHVYVVFYPQATTITKGQDISCQDIGGYHNQSGQGQSGEGVDGGSAPDGADEGGTDAGPDGASGAPGPSFVYGVIARCPTFNGLTGIDHVTGATSHELIESATDPSRTYFAFSLVDFDHLAWNYNGSDVSGSELADICASSEAEIYQRMVGNFVVQRSWSNQAAEANQDPCVPPIPAAYFNSAPDLDDTFFTPDPVDPTAVLFPTTGVSVPLGQSRTITLHLFSTEKTPDWYVGEAEYHGADAGPSLSFAFDKPSGNNGDVIHLTLTRTATGPLPGGNSEIDIASSPNGDFTEGTYQSWRVFVTQ